MAFERVLLTGAAGQIGSCLRPALREGRAELRLNDLADFGRLAANEVASPGDLADPAVVDAAVAGVDAIVHLGGVPDEAAFDVLAGPNLHGAFHVFDAARRAGVRRVVYASSNRIAGLAAVDRRLTGDEAPEPDGLYGATKAFGEALGRMYAGRFGLEVVCVRIGSFEERPSEPRHLHTWLSHGDAIRLFRACLDAPSPLGFRVVYGVSNNARNWWSLDAARALGYEPRDDAERYAAEIAGSYDSPIQAGRFAEPGYGRWA